MGTAAAADEAMAHTQELDSAAFLASSPIFYYTPRHAPGRRRRVRLFRSRRAARDAMPPRGALTLTWRASSVRFSEAPRGGEIRAVRAGTDRSSLWEDGPG